MTDGLIKKYKALRTERFLGEVCTRKYAFVGMGQHSLSNLYPVLDYLKVPLKYICVTSERKAALISAKFPGVTGTASLETILKDPEVAGVFVAASPAAHFGIASKVLAAGKALFIEKPPCSSLKELENLAKAAGNGIFEAGLQKRYAPAVRILKKRLSIEKGLHYDLHYITGAYPEGDTLTDLFIHPLDLAVHLFGKAEVQCCKAAGGTMILILEHEGGAIGTLELSTEGSWTDAEEILTVRSGKGCYRLSQMEELTFAPVPGKILGIPSEKILRRGKTVEYLYSRNNFNPVLANNQIVSAGFFDEIHAFVAAVEDSGAKARSKAHPILSSFDDIRPTYRLINSLAATK